VTGSGLEPRPWWAGTGEMLLNGAIIVAAGAPAAVYLDDPLLGGVVGCAVLLLVQIAYWRGYRGEALTEVYDVGQ